MLRGLIPIHEAFKEDFDEIKSFCDLNDMQISLRSDIVCGLSKTKTNV